MRGMKNQQILLLVAVGLYIIFYCSHNEALTQPQMVAIERPVVAIERPVARRDHHGGLRYLDKLFCDGLDSSGNYQPGRQWVSCSGQHWAHPNSKYGLSHAKAKKDVIRRHTGLPHSTNERKLQGELHKKLRNSRKLFKNKHNAWRGSIEHHDRCVIDYNMAHPPSGSPPQKGWPAKVTKWWNKNCKADGCFRTGNSALLFGVDDQCKFLRNPQKRHPDTKSFWVK